MIHLPLGSLLLTSGWLLLAGGFGRLNAQARRFALIWLGGVLLAHLLALWVPQALLWSYWLLFGGALVMSLPGGLRPLGLSALAAALATVLLLWPDAFERALDPLALSGIGGALVAALLAPSGAEVGVAALAAALGGAILRSGATLSAPPPDLEASYQLIGVALAAGFALSALRRRVAPRLWGGAAHV